LAIPSTAIYTASLFVKANGRTKFALQIGSVYAEFNLSTETAAVIGGGASDAASILALPNGWYRCTFTRSATADETAFIVFNNGSTYSYTGNAALGFYIWGAQLESGAFPTSYIPTTTATATRSADSAVVNPISSFYNQSEGTLFAEASRFQLVTNSKFLAFVNGSDTTKSIVIDASGATPQTDQKLDIANTTNQANIVFGGASTNTIYRLGGVYKSNDFHFAQNGTLGTPDSSGSIPDGITHLGIGRFPVGGSAFPLNGHIRRIAYWPRRLSNTLLQQLTT
jgi:hypothetical protein